MLPQIGDTKVTHCHYEPGSVKNLGQTLGRFVSKNIVGVGGDTEVDGKKPMEPKRRPRTRPCKMGMHMTDTGRLQLGPKPQRFIHPPLLFFAPPKNFQRGLGLAGRPPKTGIFRQDGVGFFR